jgi:hypothetical protein
LKIDRAVKQLGFRLKFIEEAPIPDRGGLTAFTTFCTLRRGAGDCYRLFTVDSIQQKASYFNSWENENN